MKQVSWFGGLLVVLMTMMLVLTARQEEQENITYFGEAYRAYMTRTKMFVPFLF